MEPPKTPRLSGPGSGTGAGDAAKAALDQCRELGVWGGVHLGPRCCWSPQGSLSDATQAPSRAGISWAVAMAGAALLCRHPLSWVQPGSLHLPAPGGTARLPGHPPTKAAG